MPTKFPIGGRYQGPEWAQAAGLVIRHKEKVLLLLRSKGERALTWGLPAGHREDGETPLQCAIRESGEELGHLPRNVYIKKKWAHTIFRGTRFVAWLCESPILFRPAQLDKREHSLWRWYGKEEIKNLKLHEGAEAILKKLAPDLLTK